MAPNRPKMGHLGAQEAQAQPAGALLEAPVSKMAPRWLQNGSRWPQVIQDSLVGAFLGLQTLSWEALDLQKPVKNNGLRFVFPLLCLFLVLPRWLLLFTILLLILLLSTSTCYTRVSTTAITKVWNEYIWGPTSDAIWLQALSHKIRPATALLSCWTTCHGLVAHSLEVQICIQIEEGQYPFRIAMTHEQRLPTGLKNASLLGFS